MTFAIVRQCQFLLQVGRRSFSVSSQLCRNVTTRMFKDSLDKSIPKTQTPLRILFCGSDNFSCASLLALHKEQQKNPKSIKSIDVLCRPGKPSGRGLKTIREAPIKKVAEELGLKLHERDTFTGWTLPLRDFEPIDLIVAVSFGLFVPRRIIESARYGGLNVHPSLLPDLHGPAPLHHALIDGDTHIGVTLQSLDAQLFDHGNILLQTFPPGFKIPNRDTCTYDQLLEFITPKAANILVQGIRKRVYLPGYKPLKSKYDNRKKITSGLARHALKITTDHRYIDLRDMNTSQIMRRNRVLGRLWFWIRLEEDQKRVIVEGVEVVRMPEILATLSGLDNNDGSVVRGLKTFNTPDYTSDSSTGMMISEDGMGVIIRVADSNQALLIREATIEGGKKEVAAKSLFEKYGELDLGTLEPIR